MDGKKKRRYRRKTTTGMEKTSAPDGTLVNEKQQKVKNICKRTLASRYPVYHRIPSSVPFPFHSIDNVQHPL